MLNDLVRTAYQQAEKAYDEAIAARASIDQILDAVPVEDRELYKRVLGIQEAFVQSENAAWRAKNAVDNLMMDVSQAKPEDA